MLPAGAQPPGSDPALLQENLESEIHRAAAPQQVDGRVEVDVAARGQDERALGVVPRALELLVPPVLDPVYLRRVGDLQFSRRHARRPSAVGYWSHSVFVHYDVSVVPFLGGFRSGFVSV